MDIMTALTIFVLGLLGVIFLGAVIIVVIVIIMACKIAFKRVMDGENNDHEMVHEYHDWQKDLWKDIQEAEDEKDTDA